uniref:LRAT domain-containing protein n=1 Tax=Panagrolaimus sp. JU765 TaxID=591449 RepID=A0AC34RTL1_9BILA
MNYWEVPEPFRNHVEHVLAKEWMGDECKNHRLYGKTPIGQHYTFIITKVIYYAVILIVDEEHRDLPIHRQENVHCDYVVERHTFFTPEGAIEYRNAKHAELSEGVFEGMAFRIRKLPKDCLKYPDKYLFPGDYIQRYCAVPFGNHEGVYMGNGKVAHINNESSTASAVTVISEKSEARAIVSSLKYFLVHPDQELRVIVHCFRRKRRQDICSTAYDLVRYEYGKGQYNVLWKNFQHFASYCVLGEEYMSDEYKIELMEFDMHVAKVEKDHVYSYRISKTNPDPENPQVYTCQQCRQADRKPVCMFFLMELQISHRNTT